jgi:hypothetical protein
MDAYGIIFNINMDQSYPTSWILNFWLFLLGGIILVFCIFEGDILLVFRLKSIIVGRDLLWGGTHLEVQKGWQDVDSQGQHHGRWSPGSRVASLGIGDLSQDLHGNGANPAKESDSLETVVVGSISESPRPGKAKNGNQDLQQTAKDRNFGEEDKVHGHSNRAVFQGTLTKVTDSVNAKKQLTQSDKEELKGIKAEAASVVATSPCLRVAGLIREEGKLHKGKRAQKTRTITENTQHSHGSHEPHVSFAGIIGAGDEPNAASCGFADISEVGDEGHPCKLGKGNQRARQKLVSIVMDKAEVPKNHRDDSHVDGEDSRNKGRQRNAFRSSGSIRANSGSNVGQGEHKGSGTEEHEHATKLPLVAFEAFLAESSGRFDRLGHCVLTLFLVLAAVVNSLR